MRTIEPLFKPLFSYCIETCPSPSLLEKLLSLCGTGDLKLLLSEVVLLELERAAKGAADSIVKGLVEVSNQVNANSRDGRVSNELATEFEKEIREAKNAVKDRADRALDKIRGAAKDADCSALVSLDATDVLEATKIAVAGEKPSKSKGKWGLLQGDCLIVAGLERFVRKHGEDRVVLCGSNTSDFSVCSGGVRRHKNAIVATTASTGAASRPTSGAASRP